MGTTITILILILIPIPISGSKVFLKRDFYITFQRSSEIVTINGYKGFKSEFEF